MKVEITNHALERFVERGGLLHHDPELALKECVGAGRVLRERTASGHVLVEAAGLRFVCDRIPGGLLVITVLSQGDAEAPGDGILDAADDYAAEAAGVLARLTEQAERLGAETRRAELVYGALLSARNKVQKAIRELTGAGRV